jgi:hypothetical protein
MPLLKNVEGKIRAVEGFDVAIKYPNGRDIRGDRDHIPGYPYDRMAKNAMTVSAWREIRFHPAYVGFDVDVLDARGNVVAGNTRLASVRDTYLDD